MTSASVLLPILEKASLSSSSSSGEMVTGAAMLDPETDMTSCEYSEQSRCVESSRGGSEEKPPDSALWCKLFTLLSSAAVHFLSDRTASLSVPAGCDQLQHSEEEELSLDDLTLHLFSSESWWTGCSRTRGRTAIIQMLHYYYHLSFLSRSCCGPNKEAKETWNDSVSPD